MLYGLINAEKIKKHYRHLHCEIYEDFIEVTEIYEDFFKHNPSILNELKNRFGIISVDGHWQIPTKNIEYEEVFF